MKKKLLLLVVILVSLSVAGHAVAQPGGTGDTGTDIGHVYSTRYCQEVGSPLGDLVSGPEDLARSNAKEKCIERIKAVMASEVAAATSDRYIMLHAQIFNEEWEWNGSQGLLTVEYDIVRQDVGMWTAEWTRPDVFAGSTPESQMAGLEQAQNSCSFAENVWRLFNDDTTLLLNGVDWKITLVGTVWEITGTALFQDTTPGQDNPHPGMWEHVLYNPN